MDITEANFMDAVIKCPVPVVLDFWASWCEPCKQLTPKLEGIARSAKGAIRLAKVNADEARALTAQLQVRSLPTVFGIVGGRAVASFEGSAGDQELRGFFDQLLAAGEKMGAVATPLSKASDAVASAHALIDEGRAFEALGMLPTMVESIQNMRAQAERQLQAAADGGDKGAAQAIAAGGTSGPLFDLDAIAARAVAGLVRALAASATDAAATSSNGPDCVAEGVPTLGDIKSQVVTYADMLRGRYRAHTKLQDVSRALAAADLLMAASPEHGAQLAPLLEAVAASPGDHGARIKLAEAQLAVGQHQEAVDNCLAVVKAEPGWSNGAARVLALKIFESLGPAHPVATAGRRALSKLLFR